MKLILSSIIFESQSAFVSSRAILDNFLISTDIMHYLKRKKQGREGFTALKIDMSKAYDRVEWEFLKQMIIQMGFDKRLGGLDHVMCF